jgi:hypothetical protein
VSFRAPAIQRVRGEIADVLLKLLSRGFKRRLLRDSGNADKQQSCEKN